MQNSTLKPQQLNTFHQRVYGGYHKPKFTVIRLSTMQIRQYLFEKSNIFPSSWTRIAFMYNVRHSSRKNEVIRYKLIPVINKLFLTTSYDHWTLTKRHG